MRFNERELKVLARTGVTEKEGRLQYRSPTSKRDGYKGRWFRLKGNLLFYFKTNERGALGDEQEAKGVLVLEKCQVQLEQVAGKYMFSIRFDNEPDKVHYFYGASKAQCEEWVNCIQKASYEYLRHKLTVLQAKLIKLTGRDPILTLSLGNSIVPKTMYDDIQRKLSAPSDTTSEQRKHKSGSKREEIAEIIGHSSSAPTELQYLM